MKAKSKKTLAFILAMIMGTSGLSSCSNKNNINKETYEDVLTQYLNYFENKSVRYYDDFDRLFYITNLDVKEAIENSETKQECDYQYDGNYLNVFDKIIENSKNEMANTEYEYLFCGDEANIDEEKLKLKDAFLNALKKALYKWDHSCVGDKNDDYHVATTLSITFDSFGPETELARYLSDENKIILHISYIESYCIKNELDLQEILTWIIEHEFNHLRQHPCSCKINKGQAYTFTKGSYQDIGAMLIESSAESAIYLEDGNISSSDKIFTSYTYGKARYYESCLMLINLFQENSGTEEYYEAIFNTDLKALYNYFGAETEDEIYNFYELLFSVDVLSEEQTFDEKDLVGLSYNVNFFNYILKEMVEYTNRNKDFSLEQNIVMLNLVQNVIVNLPGNNKYVYENNDVKKMINELIESSYQYTVFLSQNYNVSIEEINDLQQNNNLTKEFIDYLNKSGINNGSKKVKDLLNRFSNLENIWYALGPVDYNGYNSFIEESGISYTK